MIGNRLRQYVIAEKLGEGGMGVVWRAHDTVLERDVALKVLPSDSAADEVRRERFFREARAASALNHPNIITVYEINSDEGIAFIAMELVEGETLASRLGRGPLPVEQTLTIARQVAEAVARAHRAGIVHRDLKPGNVMINADGLVKVLDFGLAKVGDGPARDRTDDATRLALTRAGTALGTMGYMAPEQALGDPADARSDVFAFGVILYEMLAGALPFQGHTNTELLRALHFSEPKPLEEVRPDVASWVASIVAKALAKDPKDRFENMGEVAAALRASVVVPSAPARVETRSTPRRWGRVESYVGLAIGLAFSVWALVPWDTLFDRDRPDEPPPAADTSPAALAGAAAQLLQRYDRAGNVDRAIEQLRQAIDGDPDYATAYAYLGQAYRLKNQLAPDAQWLRLGREYVDRALMLNADLAAAHLASGFLALDARNEEEARRAFDRALALDPTSAQARAGLALTLATAGRDQDALAAFAQAVAAAPDDWRPHYDQGAFHYRRGRYGEAVAAWETARRLTTDNALLQRNLGAAYYMDGRADEGASALQRALEIQPSGPVYTNLGNIRFFQGRYADAADAFERAVKLDASNSLTWGNLGDAYRWAPGRRRDAAGAYQQALRLLDAQLAATPADPNLRTRRALYLAKLGDVRAGLAALGDIEATQTLTGQMWVRMATVHELAGDRGRALDMLARAVRDGYPQRELDRDPEFLNLRGDLRYQNLIGALTTSSPR